MKRTINLKKLALLAGAGLILSACASVGDVDNSWCPVDETITLSADALFKFDKSGVNDMLPQGRAELDELANTLNNNYAQIDSLELTGHTDRLGAADYNQRLSEARANTVKRYLESKGVNAPITTQGKGKAEPVTTSCEGSGQALIDCLQPDRRVDVRIQGLKRG